jgi:hypothetical protein
LIRIARGEPGRQARGGSALAVIFAGVSMPVKSLLLLRPGDERSAVMRQLSFYPFGPMSWTADRR